MLLILLNCVLYAFQSVLCEMGLVRKLKMFGSSQPPYTGSPDAQRREGRLRSSQIYRSHGLISQLF